MAFVAERASRLESAAVKLTGIQRIYNLKRDGKFVGQAWIQRRLFGGDYQAVINFIGSNRINRKPWRKTLKAAMADAFAPSTIVREHPKKKRR